MFPAYNLKFEDEQFKIPFARAGWVFNLLTIE